MPRILTYTLKESFNKDSPITYTLNESFNDENTNVHIKGIF